MSDFFTRDLERKALLSYQEILFTVYTEICKTKL
jgi:hypothetical protein